MIFEIENFMSKNFAAGHYNYQAVNTIPILDKNDLSYEAFFQNFMLPNVPCVIRQIANNWESSKCWHTEGNINYDYLRNKYASLNVRIYDCLKRYYNCQESYETSFSEYLNYFQESHKNTDKLEYLKNWHLKQHTDDCFYEVPIFFASDWLNEYYVNCVKNDDYRFVYMGPEHSWTPFHADVFSSYSWSVNVCGRKKWIFFPPGEELLMKGSSGDLPYDLTDINVSTRHYEIIQEPFEAIFVPSGWHHQVWNLEDTISINHNWVNGCNINMMYDSLLSTLTDVEKEIEDLRDTEDYNEHCQLMLNSEFGMDFKSFYEFLKYISLSRIKMIEGSATKVLFHQHEIGDNHILFDLRALKNVLRLFISREEINSLNCFKVLDTTPIDLLNLVENTLK